MPGLSLRRRRPADVREWEYEIAHDLAPHVADSRVAARAYRPSHPAHVPDGALKALGEAVGALTVRDLVVVPAATLASVADTSSPRSRCWASGLAGSRCGSTALPNPACGW